MDTPAIYFVLMTVFFHAALQVVVVGGAGTENNVALGKISWQSSDHGLTNLASSAVDESVKTCSRTGEEKGANWTVDLGSRHIISTLKINTGFGYFGQSFEVYIGDENDDDIEGAGERTTLCGYGPTGELKQEYIVHCFTGPLSGRYVTIKNKFSGGVKLCDVQVLVCEDGYFDSGCEKQCHCNDVACYKDTGQCPGSCAPGWTGSSCQEECPSGMFGAACRLICHCTYDVSCDRFTGECSTSCAESWMGPMCQTAMPRLTAAPTLLQAEENELTVRWPSWRGYVDPSLRLIYDVEYKLNELYGNTSWMSGAEVVYSPDRFYEEATVIGLNRNSFYEFRVVPIIVIGGQQVRGGANEVSPRSTSFRTKCHVPERPNITAVESWVDVEDGHPLVGITVEWTPLDRQQSNCDSIKYYEILYQKKGGSGGGVWQRAMALQSVSSKNITAGIDFNSEYWIIVVAHNNQPLDSPSLQKHVSTASISAAASRLPVGYSLHASMDIGIIAGIVICVVLICTVVLLVLLYRRKMVKYNSVPTWEPKQNRSSVTGSSPINRNDCTQSADSGVVVVGSKGAGGSVEMSPFTLLSVSDHYPPPFPPPHPPRMHTLSSTENGHMVGGGCREPPLTPTEHYPIRVDELEEYILTRRENSSAELMKEYRQLPDSNGVATQRCGEQSENRLKNRFINILPYDHSRVILDKVEGDDDSDYINASYIDGYKKPRAYIAAQGCNKWTIQDMWRMVWQENSSRIVMVTNLVEKGKTKCEVYWPEKENEEKAYGQFVVTLTDVEKTADFVIRTFDVRHASGDITRNVKQFHYTSWPDHGVPTRTSPIIAFRRKVRSHDDSHPGLILVHCSAGVGRTGAFIALDYLLDQAAAEQVVDVYNFTCTMRQDRINMIQTVEQYIFVYDALLEALKAGNTVVSCADFKTRFIEMCTVNPLTGNSPLAMQYEMLMSMSPVSKPEDSSLGSVPENKEKNRFPHILPADRHRPYLMTRVQGTNDYINAVFLDGYRNRNAYIITQMPLPHTVIDLWRLVYEHKCGTIVMLNPADENNESYGQYWPEENEECECGPFIIEAMSVEKNKDVISRELRLSYHPQSPSVTSMKKEESPRTVNQFQFHGWERDSSTTVSRLSLMSLLDMVERSQYKTGNHSIIIHCHDGVKQSGVYAVISCLWERMKDDQEVDLFQTVKQLRHHKPEIILNLEQYKFCYEMVLTYLEEFSIYSNFR